MDLAVDKVEVFVKDVPDPSIKMALQKERDTQQDIFTKRKENSQNASKYAERFPSILDFYDSYDPYEVSDKDLDAFDTLLTDIPEKFHPFFSSQHHYNRIVISNPSQMPSPVIMMVTYADKSQEEIRIPADIWRKNPTSFSHLLIRPQPIVTVQLDPRQETADADLDNNTYPRPIETHSFEVTAPSSLPSNPMQEDLDVE